MATPGTYPDQNNSAGIAFRDATDTVRYASNAYPLPTTGPGGSASNPSIVVGNVASGATDSGAPVKVGGVYNSTPPTFTNGQRGDMQLDAGGNLRINTRTSQIQVNPTITASSQYTAGNVVGGLLTFAAAVDAQLSGVLLSVTVVAKSAQTTGYKLYLFSQNPTNSTWTDKTAPAINVADLPYLIDVVTLGGSDSGLGTMTINATDGINRSLVLGTTSLYGILVCTGTPTYTSTTGLFITVSVLKD